MASKFAIFGIRGFEPGSEHLSSVPLFHQHPVPVLFRSCRSHTADSLPFVVIFTSCTSETIREIPFALLSGAVSLNPTD